MSDLLTGPIIITRYLGPTNHKGSRIVATHKRDSEQTWRKVIEWDNTHNAEENHQAAAQALLDSWPYDTDLVIAGKGHDQDAYYWLVVGRWQLPSTPEDHQ